MENTEDVYAGIEWEQGSQEARELIALAAEKSGAHIPGDAGIGLKVISTQATKRLIRAALDYALAHGRRSVTIVSKGNIMKYTEGAFRRWAYEVAEEEYALKTITEEALHRCGGTHMPEGKLLVKDRLADDMFQQVLLYPENYDVIAAPNLTGDYLADALAAQVGGIGVAPGANIGDRKGVFEPTLDAALERDLSWAVRTPGSGGTAVWRRGPDELDSRRLAEDCAAEGVLIEPGDVFFATDPAPRNFFRLGFASIAAERIEPGIERLARAAEKQLMPRFRVE